MVFSLDMVSGDPRRKTALHKGAEAGVAHYSERGKSKTRHQGGFQNASAAAGGAAPTTQAAASQ